MAKMTLCDFKGQVRQLPCTVKSSLDIINRFCDFKWKEIQQKQFYHGLID